MLHEVSPDKLLVGIHADGDELVDNPEKQKGRENSLEQSLSEKLSTKSKVFSPSTASTERRDFVCQVSTSRHP